MKQVESNASLWGWKYSGFKVDLFDKVSHPILKPVPFNYKNGDSIPMIKPIQGLINAEVFYAALTSPHKDCILPRPDHVAIGTKSLKAGEETIYVEYRRNPGMATDCVMYSPSTGELSACRIKGTGLGTEYFRLKDETGQDDSTAIYLALLPTLQSGIVMDSIEDTLNVLRNIRKPYDQERLDELYESYILVDAIKLYEAATRTNLLRINWPDSGEKLPKISKKMISSGEACPSPTKILVGNFEFLRPSTSAESINFDRAKYENALTPARKWTIEEERLIPNLPKDFVVTQAFVDLCDAFYMGKDNSGILRITQALLEGSAGTGKSAMGRAFAAVFRLPLEIYTCGDRDTKEDMVMTIMPLVSSNEDASAYGISEEEKIALNAFYDFQESGSLDPVCLALGLPTYDDCLVDAEGVWEELTGRTDVPDTSEIYRTLISFATAKISAIAKRIPKDSAVQYVSIKSSIVRAIENGHFLLFEEIGNLRDAGALSFFNDVFDKEGLGIVNTMCGDIKRHDDFIVIATTNRPEDPGVHVMNPAFRSRMQFFLTLDNPSEDVIMQRIGSKCGITDENLLRNITEVYLKTEQAGRDIGANAYLTLRSVFTFANAIKCGMDIHKAFTNFILYAVTTTYDETQDILAAVEDCALFAS